MLGNVPFPAWQPHPDVWLLVALFAVGYALAMTRLGPRLAPAGTPVVTRFQVASFSAGLLALWVASDWPIHDVAERYLFSVHMVQHVTYSMIAAPLMLIGTPDVARALAAVAPVVARDGPATCPGSSRRRSSFNVVVIVTHTPFVVNAALEHALLHFGIHTLIFVSSLIVWMPLLSPLPGGAAPAAARAHAVPLPAVGRPDRAGVVPHVRRDARCTRSTTTCPACSACRRSPTCRSPES